MNEKKNKICIWIVFFLVTTLPILQRGIAASDELYLRRWGQQGLKTFLYNQFLHEDLEEGRILGFLGNIKFLAYLSSNKYVFGAVNIAFLLISVVLLCVILYMAGCSVSYCIAYGTAAFAFLPMLFESGIPAAFIVVICQPLIVFELSLITYINFCRKRKKIYLLGAGLLYFWGMCLYEFICTYIFLFICVSYIENIVRTKEKKRFFTDLIAPFAAAFVYIVCYFAQSHFFPSIYEGTTLGSLSPVSILKVLFTVAVAALPGYFALFNKKYLRIFAMYNGGKVSVENFFRNEILIYVVVAAAVCYFCYKFSKKCDNTKKESIILILCGLVYSVIPILPNAIVKLYQDLVSFSNFTWIPISYYIYLAEVFTISYVIWNILCKKNNNVLWILFSMAFVYVSSRVQISNYEINDANIRAYDKVCEIENFLKLDYWKDYNNTTIGSTSLYQTRNNLIFDNVHWTEYSEIYGNNIEFLPLREESEDIGQCDYYVVMQSENEFFIYGNDKMILSSRKKPGNKVALYDNWGNLSMYDVDELISEENGYSFYKLLGKND